MPHGTSASFEVKLHSQIFAWNHSPEAWRSTFAFHHGGAQPDTMPRNRRIRNTYTLDMTEVWVMDVERLKLWALTC